jgi:predicted nucleic acid-binding protein
VVLNRSALEKRVASGDRLLIDTSVLIAYFDGSDDSSSIAAVIIDDLVKSGRNPAVISPITAMEILVRPLRSTPSSVPHVHGFLTKWPNLTLLPVDIHVAQEAAALRASHGFKAPDALVIATGIVGQVAHLITNDGEWRKKLAPLKDRLRITMPRDYA